MDIFGDLGIEKYINAHDTITLYGGSRMSDSVHEAMRQISSTFVDLKALQKELDSRIAEMTNNEDAFITNGAAGGVATAAAICIARGSDFVYRYLPMIVNNAPNEFIVFHGQHVVYDKGIENAGGVIKFVGDSDEVLEFDLENSITEKTAGIFYFPSINFERASLSLEKTVEIAHRHNIPVIVDAAAQLPPRSNLWSYTAKGADLVVFSGGKSIGGPQDSGLLLGRRDLIEQARRFGAPEHGVLRVCKTSRESMAGLYYALKEYLDKDEQAEWNEYSEMVDRIISHTRKCKEFEPYRCEHGSVGQTYPRVFASVKDADRFCTLMKRKHVFIGRNSNTEIYISVQNITSEECDEVIAKLNETIEEV